MSACSGSLGTVRKRVFFVTSNAGKALEVNRYLGSTFVVRNISLDLPEIQGSAEEIALQKCTVAARMVNKPVFTEDVSLCFHALGGMPGPYIKWFLASLAPSGLHQMLSAFEDKRAYALCTFAFCSSTEAADQGNVQIFTGRADGMIVSPRTVRNFGWDPIFQPEGLDLTFDEMDLDEKAKISHRGRGLALLREYLLENLELLEDAGEDEESGPWSDE